MGGLDIFFAREVDNEWGFVQQMEEPVNSTADDISYTSENIEGSNGFFASNRLGKNFDIFSFRSLFPIFSDCNEQQENDYTYVFEEGLVKLDTTTLKLIWDMGDGNVMYGEKVEYTYASTGLYEISLSTKDSLTNEIVEQVARYELEVTDIEQPYITAAETVVAGTPVLFDASKTYLPDMEITDYYWIFGDGTRKRGLSAEHTYLTPGTYKVQLGVTGRNNEKVCIWREITVKYF
jgi:PKD repeat protein